MKPKFLLLFLLFLSQAYFSQNNDNRYIPKEYVEITHPEWSKNATIYEVMSVNTLQKELSKHLKNICQDSKIWELILFG